jgi:hypothetical protein
LIDLCARSKKQEEKEYGRSKDRHMAGLFQFERLEKDEGFAERIDGFDLHSTEGEAGDGHRLPLLAIH